MLSCNASCSSTTGSNNQHRIQKTVWSGIKVGGRELTLGQGNVKGNTLLRFKAVYCSSLESAVKMLSRFMFLDNRLAWQMWVRNVEYCVYNAVYAGILCWMLFFIFVIYALCNCIKLCKVYCIAINGSSNVLNCFNKAVWWPFSLGALLRELFLMCECRVDACLLHTLSVACAREYDQSWTIFTDYLCFYLRCVIGQSTLHMFASSQQHESCGPSFHNIFLIQCPIPL